MKRAIQVQATVNAVWKVVENYGEITRQNALRAVCTGVAKVPEGVGPIRFVAMMLHVVNVGANQEEVR